MLGMVEARQATTPKPESQTHSLQLHVWSRKKQGGRNGAEHMHKKERGLGMYKQHPDRQRQGRPQLQSQSHRLASLQAALPRCGPEKRRVEGTAQVVVGEKGRQGQRHWLSPQQCQDKKKREDLPVSGILCVSQLMVVFSLFPMELWKGGVKRGEPMCSQFVSHHVVFGHGRDSYGYGRRTG